VDGADCCLIGVILGVTMKKIFPIALLSTVISANIAQYVVT